ncbi:hypothetical protein HKBW3C_00355, partial [Candidatus Hakubella thermalkaliphila]
MKPQVWKFSAVAAVVMVFLALGVYLAFFAAPRAVAGLALQVNPAVNLTLDERNNVIDAEGLDEQGELLLAELDVIGKEVQEALRAIAGALREAGLLSAERKLVVALYPVGDRLGEAELATLVGTADQALRDYLAEHGLPVEVVSVVLTAKLYDATRAAGLLPVDYADLVAAVGPQATTAVLDLQEKLGIDPALFREEFGTIAAALVDIIEAGITEEAALSILERALVADPGLEELTTITAAMIDLHEAGATQESIMAVFTLVEEQVAAGIERALLLEEVSTIVAAKIDLLEAGIPEAEALTALKAALVADPGLEELTTITAAVIDLVEEGLSVEEALARVEAAIKADPTLERFDDLIEAAGEEKEEVDEPAQPDRPRPGEPEPGATEAPDKPEVGEPETGATEAPDKPEVGEPETG